MVYELRVLSGANVMRLFARTIASTLSAHGADRLELLEALHIMEFSQTFYLKNPFFSFPLGTLARRASGFPAGVWRAGGIPVFQNGA